jgi:hypothetical protein
MRSGCTELQMIYPDGTRYASLSAPDFMSVAERNRVFEAVARTTTVRAPLSGWASRGRCGGGLVSGPVRCWACSSRWAAASRCEEHEPGGGDVAVLDHGFWQREFGGSGTRWAARCRYRRPTYTVVGVLAPGAALPEPADMYLPLPYDETFDATTGGTAGAASS